MTGKQDKSAVYQAIYDEAYNYLLSFDGVNKQLIEKHLKNWKVNRANSLNDVYLRMLKSIKKAGDAQLNWKS